RACRREGVGQESSERAGDVCCHRAPNFAGTPVAGSGIRVAGCEVWCVFQVIVLSRSYLVWSFMVLEKNGPAGPTHGAPSGVGFKAPIPMSADVDSSLTPAGLEAA